MARGYGAALGSIDAVAARHLAQESEHGSREDAEDGCDHLGVMGQDVTQTKGKRQHALPDRDPGKYTVDQVSRGVHHTASAT